MQKNNKSIVQFENHYKTNIIFYRMIITFIIMIFIFTILLFAYQKINTQRSVDMLKEHISQRFFDTTSNIALSITDLYSDVLVFSENTTVKNSLTGSAEITDQARVNFPMLVKLISDFQQALPNHINKLYVYDGNGMVFYNDGSADFDLYFDKINIYEDYSSQFLLDLLDEDFTVRILSPTNVHKSNSASNILPIAVQKENYTTSAPLVFLFEININTLLNELALDDIIDGKTFIVLPDSKGVISTEHESGGLHEHLMASSGDKKNMIFSTNYSGVDYYVTKYTDTLGISYFSVLSENNFTDRLDNNLTDTLIYVFILSFALMSIVFVSVKINKPISQLLKIIRTKNDDNNINDSIKVFLQNNTSEEDKLVTLQNNYMNIAFIDILNNAANSSVHPFLSNFSIDYNNEDMKYCILTIRLQPSCSDDDTDKISETIEKLDFADLFATIFNRYVPSIVVEYSKKHYCCLFYGLDDIESKTVKAINFLHDIFQYDFDYLSFHMSRTPVFNQYDKLSEHFEKAEAAYYKYRKHSNYQLINAEGIKLKEAYALSEHDIGEIKHHAQLGNYKLLTSTIKSVYKNNIDLCVAGGLINSMLIKIYFIVVQSAESTTNASSLINQYEFFALNSNIITTPINENLEKLFEYCEKICETGDRKKETSAEFIVSRAVKFIHEEYQNDIYLELIAESLNVSPKYLSKIFKKITNQNISNYIVRQRISEAKKLIVNTDETINNIAVKVGFTSKSTFYRLFKNIEGVSPSDYRK